MVEIAGLGVLALLAAAVVATQPPGQGRQFGTGCVIEQPHPHLWVAEGAAAAQGAFHYLKRFAIAGHQHVHPGQNLRVAADVGLPRWAWGLRRQAEQQLQKAVGQQPQLARQQQHAQGRRQGGVEVEGGGDAPVQVARREQGQQQHGPGEAHQPGGWGAGAGANGGQIRCSKLQP